MELSTKDVTLNRNKFIGGSEIAIILGQSRYSTPYELWATKTGRIPPKNLDNNEAVQLGNKLEDFVAKLFTEKTGKAVRKAPKVYQHPDYPFLVAHIDRLITNSDELLEIKTCNASKNKEWENDIPQEYIYQVIYYLGITGKKRGWLCCLIGGQKFDYKVIDFDKTLFELMVKKAIEFWDMVQKDIPPAVKSGDNEILDLVFPETTEEMIENNELEDLVAYRQELSMHIEEMQKEKEEIEAQLKEYIGERLGFYTLKYQVTWKPQSNKRLNTALLKQDYPEIFNDYVQENSFKVLRINKRKEI